MTILLQWLVKYAWIFYVACAIGALIYVIRAFAAQRERSLALFTLERETAASRVIQAWVMVLVFVVIGAAVFLSTTFVLPGLPVYNAGNPPPTSTPAAGVEVPIVTPVPTSAPLPTLTFTPMVVTVSAPTPALLPTQTPAPTPMPEGGISGDLNARFGDFAELVGYSLPSAQVTTSQPLMLTLYWRKLAGDSPVNYMVFTHLLTGDGEQLIAQHDGAPAGGTRPLDTWASGETIVDVHPLAFYDAAYTGPARIAVGLYDPASGRVLTNTGQDRVVLPVMINVVSQ